MPKKSSALTFRRLLSLARPEAKRLGLGLVFLVVGSALGLLYPQGIRLIVDGASGKVDARMLDRAALGMMLGSVIFGLAIAVRFVLFSTAGERVVTALRARLFAAILDQEIAFFDQRRTGELTSRLTSDTSVLQNAVSVNISMLLRNLAQALGGIGFLLYTSPKLTVIMLAVVPPVALGAFIYGRRVRKLSRDVQDALAAAGEVAEESIAGVRTVRSFAAEPREADRYRTAVWKAMAVTRRRIVAGSAFMAVASFASFTAAALVLWYGGRMVIHNELSVGQLTSFLVYTLMVAFALGGLVDLWADLLRAAGAGERVFELLDRQPQIPVKGGERPAFAQGRVEMQDVRFSYPTRPETSVLDGISLTIAPGEVVALVGPSGSGKSTIAALLARFYEPQTGVIRFDGHDLRTLDPTWLRTRIGTVAQEPTLFSTTVAENIRYGRPDATEADVQAAARVANAHDFVAALPQGYDTPVGERGVQLSGGQKQRIAIARAVLKDPRLLIMDEATSALDAESEHLVQQALDRLMKGRTTLIIAHRLSTVRDADRVVVLEAGHIVQTGSHDTLVKQDGLYRRLVERQFVVA